MEAHGTLRFCERKPPLAALVAARCRDVTLETTPSKKDIPAALSLPSGFGCYSEVGCFVKGVWMKGCSLWWYSAEVFELHWRREGIDACEYSIDGSESRSVAGSRPLLQRRLRFGQPLHAPECVPGAANVLGWNSLERGRSSALGTTQKCPSLPMPCRRSLIAFLCSSRT